MENIPLNEQNDLLLNDKSLDLMLNRFLKSEKCSICFVEYNN